MADVFIGTVNALEVVRLKQSPWRPTLCNKRELPAEIINILDTAIAATRTEGTHDVSAVAGKQHPPGLTLRVNVRIPTELKVDPKNVVWPAVDENAFARVERRLEPKPPITRVVRGRSDIGDQELFLEFLAFELKSKGVTHRAACPVGGQQPTGLKAIGSVRRVHLNPHGLIEQFKAQEAVLPAKLDQSFKLRCPLYQIFLSVVLL